jgi:hypothetical protein
MKGRTLMSRQDWIWMPHAGHLCVSNKCRFHLNTYVNGFIVSTVGEYWPDQIVRRIFVEAERKFESLTLNTNNQIVPKYSKEVIIKLLTLKGDDFDDAYMELFGYSEIGHNRLYETMVFNAKPSDEEDGMCCPYRMLTPECLFMEGYNEAKDAYEGHIAMCEKMNKITGRQLGQILQVDYDDKYQEILNWVYPDKSV